MSEGKLKLDIVTPHGAILSKEVDEVSAPGTEGEFGVVVGHAPFITTLKSGLLTYKADGKEAHYFVSWGYAEVGPAKVVILADSAERIEDIDVERALEAKRRAEERLKHEAEMDRARAEAALDRAVSRIHIVQRFK